MKNNHTIPDGFYEYTWQWVNENFDPEHYKDIHPRHDTTFRLPKCLKEDEIELFEHLSPHVTSYGAFVTAIPGGRLVGDGTQFAVISQDHKLIHDVSRSGESEPGMHWIFQQEQLPKMNSIKGNAAFLDTIPSWHNNYYHWMFDVLAKFDLLKRSGFNIDYYILNPRKHPFQYETLQLLGIPEEKIIENYHGLHLQADQLVLASQPTMVPEWACHFLTKAIKDQCRMKQNPRYKYVYISRKNAAGRKVINETELIEILEKMGFTVIELEKLAVLEQASVFASAELIISPHGAGLSNLLFANKGTKLIELFSPAYVHPIYWLLSNRLNVDYHYCLGEGERLEKDLYKEWPSSGGNDDITININKLKKVLRRAGY